MIKHIVLLDLPDGHDEAELHDILNGLDGLRDSIAGYDHFEHGPNLDFERMSKDRNYGFICTFQSDATSRAYLENAEHQALGARLVMLCRGGVAGITVIDLAITS